MHFIDLTAVQTCFCSSLNKANYIMLNIFIWYIFRQAWRNRGSSNSYLLNSLRPGNNQIFWGGIKFWYINVLKWKRVYFHFTCVYNIKQDLNVVLQR